MPWLLKCKGEALTALKRLEAAVQVLEEAQRGALLWQIQRALGHAYQLLRREGEAKRAYDLARDTITSLAETIDDPDLRGQFVEAALLSLPREKLLSPRRVASQQFGGLTERERTVATLLAQGKSNREIADPSS
jgi:DNA-binding NarL/FixJ family response regulator